MARTLKVEILGDSSSLQRALGQAGSSGSKLGRTLGHVVRGGAIVAGAAIAGLGVAAKIGFDEFKDAAKVAGQTNAVIKSTGGVANVTAKHVEKLGDKLLRVSGIDDEVIKSGQNMLLTFRGIRNETGKNNDIFDQATTATLDLSVAMGKDMSSSAILVGKALQDPIRGLGALRRVGIQFTEGQEKQIKKMVEAGDVMGAQKMILKELNTEFGGSAKALGNAAPWNAWIQNARNWLGNMVGEIMPALTKFAKRLSRADGFRVKFRVAFDTGKAALASLQTSLKKVLFGSTTIKPIKLPTGRIIEWETTRQVGLIAAISAGLKGADWSEIGRKVGEGISAKVKFTWAMFESLINVIDQHVGEFAELGAKIGLHIISKLLDPAFWVKNWQVILGIAVAVFPLGKVVKLGGTVAKELLGGFAPRLVEGIGTAAFRAVDALALQFRRLPIVAQEVASRVIGKLGELVSYLGGALKETFGKVPGWVTAAFRLGFVISFINKIKDLIGWVAGLIGKLRDLAGLLPGGGGGGGGGGTPGPGGPKGPRVPGPGGPGGPRSRSSMGAAAGAGVQSVNVTFTGPVYGADSDKLAREVRNALLRMKADTGTLGLA